ncbi:MAG: DNA adenine methylase [Patescibacteria group bacterium]|nr:DNA adenine methylase [Patescibacteria group bacterium]
MSIHEYKPPFPYFGGKSKAASIAWSRFGDVRNYVEPFFGSGATLFLRPQPFVGTETVNDADGLLANFWRAIQADPEAVASYADWPVNENDLHARHAWLVGVKDSLQARLEGDPDYFDSKIAGWWCWGMCCWIGSGFCSGKGPWHRIQDEDGNWVLSNDAEIGKDAWRQLVHLGDAGRGVNRQLGERLSDFFASIAERLSGVRVCCGDWTRVCGDTPTVKQGLTAVFLDPPYATKAKRTSDLYRKDNLEVADAVREWAIEHGDDKRMRIALCGYEGEHEMPDSWECVAWKARGGYGSQSTRHDNPNAKRERIWFSPHCVKVERSIFDKAS